MWGNVKFWTRSWRALVLAAVGLLALGLIGYELWGLRCVWVKKGSLRPSVPFAQAPTVKPAKQPGEVSSSVEPKQPPAPVAGQPAAADSKPADTAPEKLPLVPIRVTELEPGRVWQFNIRGPTDIQAVAAHVRAASSATIRLQGGRTYRFKAPSVPRGRVHVTTQYLPSSQSTVKDAEVPGEELPYGITKIFPQDNMVTIVWQKGLDVEPIEVVIEETGESQEIATARLARMVDSQPITP